MQSGYLVACQLGLYVGMDVARGAENTGVGRQVGSAWR